MALDYEDMGISDPQLRAERLRRGQTEHPLRVIVSGRLTIPTDLCVFKLLISPLLIVCCESASLSRRKKFAELGRLIVCGQKEVDIPQLVSILATQYHARTILCEGGPTLNDVFFRSGLVNELCLTLCPRIVGGKIAPTLSEGRGVASLKNALRGRLFSCRKGKTEWFLNYKF